MHDKVTSELSYINLYDLNYPVYVSPIPLDSNKITHIPGLYEYKHLDNVYLHVVEGYKTKDKIYLFDCVPYNLWNKKICNLTYEKRLKTLRTIVYEEVCLPDFVIHLDCVLIDNPVELIDYCENLLTQAYKKVRIMDGNAFYSFAQNDKGESLELEL